MAEVLKEFSFATRAVGVGKYPWDEWLDGRIHKLTDEDFGEVKLGTISTLIRANAKKRGKTVKVHVDKKNSVIVFQAAEGEGNGEAPAPTGKKKTKK